MLPQSCICKLESHCPLNAISAVMHNMATFADGLLGELQATALK